MLPAVLAFSAPSDQFTPIVLGVERPAVRFSQQIKLVFVVHVHPSTVSDRYTT